MWLSWEKILNKLTFVTVMIKKNLQRSDKNAFDIPAIDTAAKNVTNLKRREL